MTAIHFIIDISIRAQLQLDSYTVLNVMAFKLQMYVPKDGLEKTRNVISSLILKHHGKRHKLPVRKMELI